jgi:hypothetical protein
LLDALEQRLTSRIDMVPIEFDETFHRQYNEAKNVLRTWIDDIRRQFDQTIEHELEQYLRFQYEFLKRQTDEYVREHVQQLIGLRSNVRYAKRRHNDRTYDQEILRLVNIEKTCHKQYEDYHLAFRLNTRPVDFTQYVHVDKQFREPTMPLTLNFDYRWDQAMQSILLQSTIEHIAGSCLDLFVFVRQPTPKYPRLLEFSTSSLAARTSLTYSIDFPIDTKIVDMCWSILFLLTSSCLHQYDKYERKVHAKIIVLSSDCQQKWHRLAVNRLGIYILNDNNAIEFYNSKYTQNVVFDMKDFIDNMRLVYDLRGQADRLCTLTYTNGNLWQIDLFIGRQMELQRTLKLSETLRPPLKLLNAHRRTTWMIIDVDNHRLIVFDDRMNNIEHVPLTMAAHCATMLDDQTLVIVSPDSSGERISFYSPNTFV